MKMRAFETVAREEFLVSKILRLNMLRIRLGKAHTKFKILREIVKIFVKGATVLYYKKPSLSFKSFSESLIKTTLLSWQILSKTTRKRWKRLAHKTCVRKTLTESMQK